MPEGRASLTFASSTPGKIKKPESLGEPHYTAKDGLPRVGHQNALKRSLSALDVVLSRPDFLALFY
jgi:hypothetical protein